MDREMSIIQLARKHVGSQTTTTDHGVSQLTKNAGRLTRAWQNAVIEKYNSSVHRNYPVGEEISEQLATFCLFDPSAQTAYEMRFSKENPEIAFYKSICKVQVYNMNEVGIKKLIFIVPKEAYKKLSKGLPHKLIESLKDQFDIQIESF